MADLKHRCTGCNKLERAFFARFLFDHSFLQALEGDFEEVGFELGLQFAIAPDGKVGAGGECQLSAAACLTAHMVDGSVFHVAADAGEARAGLGSDAVVQLAGVVEGFAFALGSGL